MPNIPWQEGDAEQCKRGHDLREVGFYLAVTGRWKWCATCQRTRMQTTTAMRNIHRPKVTPDAVTATHSTTVTSPVHNVGAQVNRSETDILGWAFKGQDFDVEITEPETATTSTDSQATPEPDATPFGLSSEVWAVYREDRKHRQFSAAVRARADFVKSVKDHQFDYLEGDSDN